MTCTRCGSDPCTCELETDWRKPAPPEVPDGIPEPFPLTLVRRYRQHPACTYKEAILAVLPKWIQANPDDDNAECAVELVSRALVNFQPRRIDDPPSVYGMDNADRAYLLCEAYQQGGPAAVRQFIKEHPKAVIAWLLIMAFA